MITSLLKWAYAMGLELWTEDGKLKYRAEQGILTDEVKRQLIDNKEVVNKRLDRNESAKLRQWAIFEFGEMYSKGTTNSSELYIFRNEDDTYTVWRANWRTGNPKPLSETTLAENISFQEAFDRANNYYDWATNKNKKRKAG